MTTGDVRDSASMARAQRRSRSTRREVSVLGFLTLAIGIWAGLIAGTYAAVYWFVVDHEPEVLTYREVQVELSDYAITPDVIEVAPSTDITFLVSNVGEAQHTLVISDDVGTERLKTGESAILEAGVARDNYIVWCSVKGHRELGMEGRVIVRDGR
jgi:plastocyanin